MEKTPKRTPKKQLRKNQKTILTQNKILIQFVLLLRKESTNQKNKIKKKAKKKMKKKMEEKWY